MSNKIQDEPAFPVDTAGLEGHQTGNHTWQHPGMTLRDYFAAKAMQGRIHLDESFAITAAVAYDMADAMLKARSATNTETGK